MGRWSAVRRGQPVALALIAIVALALGLRLTFFMGVTGVDNVIYLNVAHSIARGTHVYAVEDFVPFHVGRLTMVLPLALSLRLTGPSELSVAAWPLLCSLGNVALGFLFGRRLGGTSAGLVTALGVAAYPLDALYATTPLPDTAVAFFCGLAMLCFLDAGERDGRAALLRYAAAGAALGVAYYARNNALVMLVVFAAWLAWQRRWPGRELLGTPLGLIAVLAVGTGFVVARGGSVWFEVIQSARLAEQHPQLVAARGGLDAIYEFVGHLAVDRLFQRWSILAAAGAAFLIRRRDERLALPGLWLGITYAYLELFSQYPVVSLVQKEVRYLTLLELPLLLIVGLAASRALALPPRARLLRLAPLAVLLLLPLWLAPGFRAAQRFAEGQRAGIVAAPRQVAAYLAGLPVGTVYVTYDWRLYLNYFGGFAFGLDLSDPATNESARLRRVSFDRANRPTNVEGGYVVHDERVNMAVPAAWRELGRPTPGLVVYAAD